MTQTTVPNKYVGEIPCTDAQHAKAYALHCRFGGANYTDFMQRHFWTEGDIIMSTFGSMVIGILPDGSSHS